MTTHPASYDGSRRPVRVALRRLAARGVATFTWVTVTPLPRFGLPKGPSKFSGGLS
jgi:hypothetical protein